MMLCSHVTVGGQRVQVFSWPVWKVLVKASFLKGLEFFYNFLDIYVCICIFYHLYFWLDTKFQFNFSLINI